MIAKAIFTLGATAAFMTVATQAYAQNADQMSDEFLSANVGQHPLADKMERVLTFTNDRDGFKNELSLAVNAQGAIAGGQYVVHVGDGSMTTKTFSLAELTSGAVLEEQQGIKALTVRSQIDEKNGRGPITFRFVANGLSGSYKECQAQLVKSGGAWIVVNSSGQAVPTARITTWSLGIDTIEGICKP